MVEVHVTCALVDDISTSHRFILSYRGNQIEKSRSACREATSAWNPLGGAAADIIPRELEHDRPSFNIVCFIRRRSKLFTQNSADMH